MIAGTEGLVSSDILRVLVPARHEGFSEAVNGAEFAVPRLF